MSNLDLLDDKDNTQAALQGWTLARVFNPDTRRWAVQVLPLMFAPPFSNAEQAGAFVVSQARSGHALACKALALVMSSHNPTTRNKK